MRFATTTRAGLAGIALIGAVTLALLLLGSTPAPSATARGADCRHADLPAPDAKPKQMRRAITCLINAKREKRGKRPLRGSRPLKRIARAHTNKMLKTGCFRHRCEGERPLRKRIESSAYLKGGGRYGYAENLGCARTPKAMFRAWMRSRFHKRNLLRGRYRHIGVGAKRGVPASAPRVCVEHDWATYTVLVAWRKR